MLAHQAIPDSCDKSVYASSVIVSAWISEMVQYYHMIVSNVEQSPNSTLPQPSL